MPTLERLDTPRGRSRLKVSLAAVLAAAFVAGSVAPAAAAPRSGWTAQNEAPSSFQRHFHRNHPSHARYGAYGHDRGGPGYAGAAIGAGVAGLAAGALLGDAVAASDVGPSADAVSYCADRFRSYDPSTGTYLGYDGDEHPCP